ncbi:MAG: hypothetical protein LBM96_09200 [Methanobrevibacter sp.]|nr:hypothetical protein [Candidatus Methanoflexus mossambicus]
MQSKKFNPENCFTFELTNYFNQYRSKFSLSNTIAENETQDGNTDYTIKGRNDIRIRYATRTIELNIDDYFVIECKRLDKSSNKQNKYISSGILDFVNEKYSSNNDNAFMIGYIEEGNIDDIISKINKKLKEKHIDITTLVLNKIDKVENFNYIYISKHKRKSLSPISLHHLMFDYKTIYNN